MKLHVDGQRVRAELEMLARFTDSMENEAAGTRVSFGAADTETRAWLKGLATEAGFAVRQDAVGNLFFRLEGEDAFLPAVATGSHLDAGSHGGMYDGTLGVVGGLEALRAIARSGARRQRAVEVVVLTAKEPTRFGIGCLGSRLLSGALDGEQADELVGYGGRSLRQVRQEAGCTGELREVQLNPGHWSAWVELHLEQGSRLERAGCGLGVVTGIAASAGLRYTVRGQGGHAQASLMPERRDALCAAAELVLQVENAARRSGSRDTVATVSKLEVFPGAGDTIPSRVELTVELGDTEQERQDRALRQIRAAVRRIEADRGVRIEERVITVDEPVTSAPELVAMLEQCAADRGAGSMRMVSRAGHDTLFLARLAPAAMLFVPRRAGGSQRGGEWTTEASIALGTAVLAEALLRLANVGSTPGGVA